MLWSDGTNWFLLGPPRRVKRVVICHSSSSKGFVENSPFTLWKRTFHVICDHNDKSEIVFQDWFENTLTSNLPKDRKLVEMMDSAKYPCRFIEKGPTMNMKKGEMISVLSKHEIEIPDPVPTKSVLEKFLKILKNSMSLII